MLHAPVVAPPPTLEPIKVIEDGVALWQTLSGPPEIAVGNAVTFIVLLDIAALHPVPKLEVNRKVTVPLKFAAGV